MPRRRLRRACATGFRPSPAPTSVGPGRDEHGHRRGDGDDQPPAGPAAAERHLRHARRRPRPAAARAPDGRRRHRSTTPSARSSRYFDRVSRPEQLLSALLGAMRVLTDPAETGAVTIALPAGRAGRGVRLAGRAVREAGLARPAAGRRTGCPARAAEVDPRRRAAADHRRRRRDLQRGDRGAARFVEATGIPVARDPGRQGLAALRPPAGPRRRRRDRHHGRQRARRARPTWSSAIGTRYSRLHHRVADRLPEPGRAVRQHQRRRLRRRTSTAASPLRRRRPGRPRGAARPLAGIGSRRTPRIASEPRTLARGLGRDGASGLRAAGHGPLPAQTEVIGAVNDAVRPARRRGLRRGLAARRPAQAVADARPEGVPRRVRLLVHGLRDRRRPRRQAGAPDARSSSWSATAPT